MKNLFWLVFLTTTVNINFCAGQTITEFANFYVENNHGYWQKVYKRPGMSVDSLKTQIAKITKLDVSLKFLQENESEVVFELVDKTTETDGDKWNGRVVVEVKDQKYRVTFSSISNRPGQRHIISSTIVSRSISGREAIIPETNYFDDWALDNSKNNLRMGKTKHLSKLNGEFTSAFDFKLTGQNSSW